MSTLIWSRILNKIQISLKHCNSEKLPEVLGGFIVTAKIMVMSKVMVMTVAGHLPEMEFLQLFQSKAFVSRTHTCESNRPGVNEKILTLSW